MDIEEFKVKSEAVTAACSSLKRETGAPIVVAIACSSNIEEPMILGMASTRTGRAADDQLVSALERALASARHRLLEDALGDGEVTVAIQGPGGKITKAPRGQRS